jgi:hypothetical protein
LPQKTIRKDGFLFMGLRGLRFYGLFATMVFKAFPKAFCFSLYTWPKLQLLHGQIKSPNSPLASLGDVFAVAEKMATWETSASAASVSVSLRTKELFPA